ncbi:type IV secretion system protein VirB1 [Ochrobactrum sp. 695/2009]|nr:lytic transglycosylase domain-containing protein [Brucella intermedia]PJR92433.1 type IV secretion system protein VirB1 [Ochrobactrum sp. 721/2009]PJT15743.1 type IV secretion system protein VirB1 [Ochrobactrum sp. 720/2009]PJT23895.1 type IV secretion system protein VirB1 [Ochrobactrum sp. 715/2009]PJT24039.1 type IV secretion system protein VirB1 [Ochrobactrum sp. 695/2009]PJT33570.1 type IV secretion system protein VirB1 [Ochrobactrum sp. 689/2009]
MPVVFVDVAHQCAPQIALETLAALVSVESGFNPLAIRVNSGYPLADQPATKAEAIETASIMIAGGEDIDLGLAGINSGSLDRLDLSVSDAFNICLNLKASASLLDGYYRVALEGGATRAQAEKAMLRSYFGHGDVTLGKIVGYDARILAERNRLKERLQNIEFSDEQAIDPTQRKRKAELVVRSYTSPPEQSRRRSVPPVARWDVFNSGRRSSVLVFSDEQQE